jgi:hypothetical protein
MRHRTGDESGALLVDVACGEIEDAKIGSEMVLEESEGRTAPEKVTVAT